MEHAILVRPAAAVSAAPRTAPKLAASAVIHLVAVVGVGLFAGARVLTPAAPEASFPMVFMAAPVAAEAATSLPAAALPVTGPRKVVAALSAPRSVSSAGRLPEHAFVPLPAVETAAPARMVDHPAPRPVIVPAAPEDGVELAAFESRVHRAVQQAAVYPAAAKLQRQQGRARIEFLLSGRDVAAERVSQSSQSALLDRAALDAVRLAALPAPPVGLAARQTLSVWVDFALVAED